MIEEKKDLIHEIQKNFTKLSKGQKLIAQYIIDNYDKAAFMTASKLAKTVNVSESTVVRFANALGFDGYPQLQKGLQNIIKIKLTTVQRVEMARDYSDEEVILKKMFKSDIDNIRATQENMDYEVFQAVVGKILSAENIYIIGLRSSTALAQYLGFYLNLVLDNVKVVGYGISDIFEQMLRVSEKDLVIGISFPRYSNRTVEVLKYAEEQNATIVSITDSLMSPIYGLSDYCLTAKNNMASFVDSLVAPLSLINALIIAVGMREKEEITRYFNKLEGLWDKYHVYDREK
ncbi:MurR/RpiR family transcriptional regulator [Clostridium formicaceticum]|uniref:HTH-type transcriptional regulator YbbH n=1 Tax=Clostridium formicaceticum TaxID=1497 RepID=A0AAC9WGG0_9CLOT|nr:MurR/RpiR family transcriptional regulator [Clostridium formicaceticum]AOY78417.1 N-acetylmannosamine kinase [Clostridium formicaceticum]ARE87779.1 putative HTH-type transcriptional regulator YbbH [Clostridium formicaceticum]